MYRLKFKVIPSFKFIIEKDFMLQMFRESRKNLPYFIIFFIFVNLKIRFVEINVV